MSRLEEERLSFAENSPLQQRLATDRSIRNSSNGENPGKILPASHPGSPAKRKSDTEDVLAIVNRKGRPNLFITVTMNANWPEITSNVLPGQTAYDRPDLCCRVFKMKLKEIMAELRVVKCSALTWPIWELLSSKKEAIHTLIWYIRSKAKDLNI